ncbi:MAG TPA: CHAD domain-containing protein [Caulobacteraceae bacterium]
METELKFVIDADGAMRLRELLGLPDHGRRLRSVYFDTPDLDLKSAGFSLRVREEGEKRVQGIKQSGNGSLFSRREWETPAAEEGLDFAAIDATPLGARLGQRRRASLAPAFEVDVQRAKRELAFEGAQIEVALDEGEVRTVGSRTPIRELELELKSGDPAALFALARTLYVATPTLSFRTKSARGFALARSDETYAAALAPPPLKPRQTAAEGFRAIAATCLEQIAANAEILREGRNSAAVHQLRVGARRLRSAITLFKPLMADRARESIVGELRWLARACDPARDLDVFAEQSFAPIVTADASTESLAEFGAALERRRAEAHYRARQTVSSARFRALLLETAAWIEAGDWTRDPAYADARAMKLKTFARAALDHAYQRVTKRAKSLKADDPEPRHRLRIADKSLRYAVTVLAPVFGAAGKGRVKDFRTAAAEAQDALGALTDIVSGHALCAEIAETEVGDLAIAFAAGYVTGRLSASEPARLKAARKAVRRLRRVEPFW